MQQASSARRRPHRRFSPTVPGIVPPLTPASPVQVCVPSRLLPLTRSPQVSAPSPHPPIRPCSPFCAGAAMIFSAFSMPVCAADLSSSESARRSPTARWSATCCSRSTRRAMTFPPRIPPWSPGWRGSPHSPDGVRPMGCCRASVCPATRQTNGRNSAREGKLPDQRRRDLRAGAALASGGSSERSIVRSSGRSRRSLR
jgi:hypothetical protein